MLDSPCKGCLARSVAGFVGSDDDGEMAPSVLVRDDVVFEKALRGEGLFVGCDEIFDSVSCEGVYSDSYLESALASSAFLIGFIR